ncbi:unnamed protein product [Heterotrigona itama]|uniref:Secreted protein n=1 Tax=Heterotrigona itama TaxID=395501 RepID=A0A6V7H9D3_9HYME|nr:unnamed protein product [Heterotrigona itama]
MFNKMMRIFILLTVFNIVYAYQRNFWWKIENTQRQGPNVCAVEVNDDINYAYYTESKQWSPRKICGKPT